MGVGASCPPLGQSGWLSLGCFAVLLLSKLFDVLFQRTLERPLCHINQGCSECQAVFSVNPAPATIYWEKKKSIYICSGNLLEDFSSWCQLIICPLNLIRVPCAKALGMENHYLYTYTCSHSIDRHTHKAQILTRTNKHTSRCCLLLLVSAENQTLHPSAGVIPSNQSYVAMVKIFPHELVNQAAAT